MALAAARLEELSKEQLKTGNDTSANAGSNADLNNTATPNPQPFQTARVVSSDSIASTYGDASVSKAPSPAPTSGKLNIANILADPIAWLQASDNKKPAEPPTGTFTASNPDDVLCGRGGETNHHSGNIQYRNLVKAFQPLYISSKRRDKPRIAQCIVYTVRAQGGRFLKRTDPRSTTWCDVGNVKAREKTSQALREGAPVLRDAEKFPEPPTDKPAPIVTPITAPISSPAPVYNPHLLQAAAAYPYHPGMLAYLAQPSAPGSLAALPIVTPSLPTKRPNTPATSGPRLKRLKHRVENDGASSS